MKNRIMQIMQDVYLKPEYLLRDNFSAPLNAHPKTSEPGSMTLTDSNNSLYIEDDRLKIKGAPRRKWLSAPAKCLYRPRFR